MTRDDIIRMAQEAGIDAEKDTLCRYEGWVEPLTRFAALVIANHPPQSYMTWQEGCEAGKQAERARLQAFMRQMIDAYALPSSPDGLRKRPNQE